MPKTKTKKDFQGVNSLISRRFNGVAKSTHFIRIETDYEKLICGEIGKILSARLKLKHRRGCYRGRKAKDVYVTCLFQKTKIDIPAGDILTNKLVIKTNLPPMSPKTIEKVSIRNEEIVLLMEIYMSSSGKTITLDGEGRFIHCLRDNNYNLKNLTLCEIEETASLWHYANFGINQICQTIHGDIFEYIENLSEKDKSEVEFVNFDFCGYKINPNKRIETHLKQLPNLKMYAVTQAKRVGPDGGKWQNQCPQIYGFKLWGPIKAPDSSYVSYNQDSVVCSIYLKT